MKGLDWSNERYVRLHTRNTTAWALLGYETQNLWLQLLRLMDRSGVIPLDPDAPPYEGICALLPGSNDRQIERQLQSLIDRDWLVHNRKENQLVDPSYISREEAKMSDAQRQRDSREKRRAAAMSQDVTKEWREVSRDVTEPSRAVTRSHTESQPVTPSVPSVPSVPSQAKPDTVLPQAGAKGGGKDEGILIRSREDLRGTRETGGAESRPPSDAVAGAAHPKKRDRAAEVRDLLAQLEDLGVVNSADLWADRLEQTASRKRPNTARQVGQLKKILKGVRNGRKPREAVRLIEITTEYGAGGVDWKFLDEYGDPPGKKTAKAKLQPNTVAEGSSGEERGYDC